MPCGTTGESPTLSHAEQRRVVEITVEEARGKVPVLAGAGGNDTAHVIELAREFKELGANGILSVSPYYNKPTQEGLYQHFKAIADGRAAADYSLQYSRPNRRQHRARDDQEARRDRQHHRSQRSLGKHFADGRILDTSRRNFLVLSGDDGITLAAAGAWRPRLDFGRLE